MGYVNSKFISHIKINIQIIDYPGSTLIIPIIFFMIVTFTYHNFSFPKQKESRTRNYVPIAEKVKCECTYYIFTNKPQQND